jgi:very-short-patch-repair endonuclease
VTFNQAQQNLIEKLLDARRRASAALDQAIATTAHEPLFIKNIENVQGDERDVIYFSITYGPDAAGKLNMNFGPLNLEGGHRRLNVAVTRARQNVVIFSTLLPEQIDLSKVRAAGVRDLKNYLDFALRGPRALVEQVLPTGMEPDSPFEREVIAVLRNKGWIVHPQVGVSGYRIDLGIVDPRAPGRYLLGVECDGRTYHSGATARDRDRLRQYVLEGLGWELFRIWSTDWWLNPQEPIRKLEARLQLLLNAGQSQTDESSETDILHEVVEITEVAEVAEAREDTAIAQDSLTATFAGLAPSVASGSAGFSTYPAASLEKTEGREFYAHSSMDTLRSQLVAVINTEGPVADHIVFKRISRAWGLAKTGRRMHELLTALVPKHVVATGENPKFYWPEGASADSWAHFRVPGDSVESKRPLDEVSLEEIRNIANFLVGQHGSMSVEGLARSLTRLLGISRTTVEALKRVESALSLEAESAALEIKDGIVRRRERV